jgi:hypothetical protein
MEWVNEGLTLVYMGIIIITVTALDSAARAVYGVTFGMLNAMHVHLVTPDGISNQFSSLSTLSHYIHIE